MRLHQPSRHEPSPAGAGPDPVPQGFISAREAAGSNLRRRSLLLERLDARAVRWVAGFLRLSYLPGLIEDVYTKGYENFPLHTAEAPIVGISHKKAQDVLVGIAFMAGRPLERFHDVTAVAQGGLFNGIFTYRDLVPDFFKHHPAIPPLALFSRLIGRWTGSFAKALHANPVFREGSDIPPEEEYYHRSFAGPWVTGMDYPSFVRHAGRTTLSSVVVVQKAIEEQNRSFTIFPEGKYCHEGAVTEMQNLVGVLAYRKQRPVLPVSLTYDELCEDVLGRISGWVHAGPLIPPPNDKKKIPEFLESLRETLQKNSVVTASHLIGVVLNRVREAGIGFIEEEELRRRYGECVRAALESGHAVDPRLGGADFQDERLHRFLKRRGSRLLRRAGRRYYLNEKRIARFARSERTVDDIAWNANNIRHLRLPS